MSRSRSDGVGVAEVLEHVAEHDHVEAVVLDRRDADEVEVGDVHALGEALGELRRLGVELDTDDRVAGRDEVLGDVPGGAADLEHAVAGPDDPQRMAVRVVLGRRVDLDRVLIGHVSGPPVAPRATGRPW